MFDFLKRLRGAASSQAGDTDRKPAGAGPSIFKGMVAGRAVLVLGSAPGASLDGRAPDEVLVACNGSIIPFRDTVPDVLVINAYTTAMQNTVGTATMTGLAGRHVRHVVFLVTKSSVDEMAASLRAMGVTWDTQEALTKRQRIAMTRRILDEDFTGDAISTGATAILLAHAAGAASIRLAGFSAGGGHSYMAQQTRRAHAAVDSLVLDRIGLTLPGTPDLSEAAVTDIAAPDTHALVLFGLRLLAPPEDAAHGLARRLRFFEEVTLPFLRQEAAANPNLRLCVIIDTSLPEADAARLRTLADQTGNVDILSVRRRALLREEFRAYARAQLRPGHEMVCTVRLQDDTCLSAGYTAALRRLCRPENIGSIVTHPYGIHLAPGGDGGWIARKRLDPSTPIGVAYLSAASEPRTIQDAGPYQSYQTRFAMIASAMPNAWVRVLETTPGRSQYLREGWQPAGRLAAEIAGQFPHLDLDAISPA